MLVMDKALEKILSPLEQQAINASDIHSVISSLQALLATQPVIKDNMVYVHAPDGDLDGKDSLWWLIYTENTNEYYYELDEWWLIINKDEEYCRISDLREATLQDIEAEIKIGLSEDPDYLKDQTKYYDRMRILIREHK